MVLLEGSPIMEKGTNTSPSVHVSSRERARCGVHSCNEQTPYPRVHGHAIPKTVAPEVVEQVSESSQSDSDEGKYSLCLRPQARCFILLLILRSGHHSDSCLARNNSFYNGLYF
ncbi:hypothetical protein CFOL_v3_24749 [Cephalotus follicularis]|uniref:Uncharacterized protein n=1 Tax=Cephalotus follicularis TaxID=3775 RepID=A0A1Q3CMG6_CEPFO|nr:hypothetical protein CFOL_v3_24749 [Cephalotus follicularis]